MSILKQIFERSMLSRGSFSLKCIKVKILEINCIIYNSQKSLLAVKIVFQRALQGLESFGTKLFKLQNEYRVQNVEISYKLMVVQAIRQDLQENSRKSFVYKIDFERPDSRL